MKTHARPPRAVAARNASASACMLIASILVDDFGGIEGRRKPLLFVVIARAFPELRTADAGRTVPPDDLAVGVFAEQFVEEQVLGDDGRAFHAHPLGDSS